MNPSPLPETPACDAADRLDTSRRRWVQTALLGTAGVLAGCAAPSGTGTPTPAPESPPQDTAPAPAPGTPPPLVAERQWLQSWFTGTPVRISQAGEGPVELAVPLEFSFDPGRRTVKPPLAAVLDKVAESLRRRTQLRLSVIAAPPDASGPGATPALALQRAQQLRAHLRSRGAREVQLGTASAATDALVRLQLSASEAAG